MTDLARAIAESLKVRSNAEVLLRSLLEAKEQSETLLQSTGGKDHLRTLTGKSSLDNAIASTKRMIETINRHIEQFETMGEQSGSGPVSHPSPTR